MTWNITALRELYDHLAPDETARRNHDECPSGEDRRRRLYITKSSDNQTLKCYCHNCGNGTVINLHSAPRLRRVTAPAVEKPLELPPRWRDTTQLHPKHRAWLNAYAILEHALRRGVYSMSEYELVFPYEQNGELRGYQIRYFDGRKPKWKSHGNPVAWWGEGDMCFYVEDIVSAMKLQSTGNGYVSIAGHRPKLDHEDRIHGIHSVVWLDNDKSTVIEAAEELAASLTHGKERTVLITGGTDPKRYSKMALKKVADDCAELLKSTPADGRPYHVLEILPPNQGVCA